MRLPRFRLARLSTYVVAGAIALWALVGPALVPGEIGGRVAHALEADIDLFRQELSPYGEWFEHDRYGEVWRPTHVRRDWRPYYDDGHWAYSDEYGWMWISDEPWGWAPFHYGRWAFTRDDGWIWVPGRQWGPAWVTFRSGQDSIGWAPLPPEADWDPGFGFLDDDDDYYDSDYDNYYGYDRYYGDNDFGLAEMIWAFVRPEGFLEPDFHRYAYDRRDYPRIIHRTRDITNITVINNRVVNRSIEINNIEHVTRKKVRRVRVEEADRPDRIRRRGENIVLYKPVVVEKEEKRWRSRGDGLKAEERTAKRKKRGSDDADTARQQQLEPSTGADVATEQPPLRKKKKRSDSAAEQQVEPATNADVATEQPLRKKKRKAQTLEQQIEPSAGVTDDVEQPVKKKKKRSTASQDSGAQQPADGEGTIVRKKKKRSGDANVVRQQEQQQEEEQQPRKRKKCKGEGCPDNN
jgi:hypothetical protein